MSSKITIVKEQIRSTLETIQELGTQILETEGKIPQIDIDIILEHLRNVYSDFNTLNKLNNFQHPFEKTTEPEQVVSKPVPQSEPRNEVVETKAPEVIVEKEPEKEEKSVKADENTIQQPQAEKEVIVPDKTETKEEITEPKQEAVSEAKIEVEKETTNEEKTSEAVVEQQQAVEPVEVAEKDKIEETVSSIDNQKTESQKDSESENIKVVEKEPEKTIAETETLKSTDTESNIKPKKEKTTKDTKTPNPSILDLFANEATPTVADKLKKDQPQSVLDKIAVNKEDKSIVAKMQKQPIADLKKAIGINEKFLFINELFNGNMQEYSKALDYLNNSCPDYATAKQYIEKLKAEYKWDLNKISVSVFESLVERRFL